MKPEFTTKLMHWNSHQNKRSMPWKGEKDPYKIWLSEVILQQTRVSQGWEYYQRFIQSFPTIRDLATAPEQTIFKHWEGLGYYSRCKNLHLSAKMVVEVFKGNFPSTYKEILSLKGVGPYTAAAIASFAFNLPHAVVDGNVSRVISRYFGINTPIDTKQGKELYDELANSLLNKDQPGKYNQAIMDFGATICKPQNPLCSECIQKSDCQAFQHGWVTLLPVKEKFQSRKERWFTYYVVCYKNQLYIRKRIAKDIWANLFEFILTESIDKNEQAHAITPKVIGNTIGTSDFHVKSISPFFKQQLTHQTIHGQFVMILLQQPIRNHSYHLVSKNELSRYPFPKMINTYLNHQE